MAVREGSLGRLAGWLDGYLFTRLWLGLYSVLHAWGSYLACLHTPAWVSLSLLLERSSFLGGRDGFLWIWQRKSQSGLNFMNQVENGYREFWLWKQLDWNLAVRIISSQLQVALVEIRGLWVRVKRRIGSSRICVVWVRLETQKGAEDIVNSRGWHLDLSQKKLRRWESWWNEVTLRLLCHRGHVSSFCLKPTLLYSLSEARAGTLYMTWFCQLAPCEALPFGDARWGEQKTCFFLFPAGFLFASRYWEHHPSLTVLQNLAAVLDSRSSCSI